MDFTLFYLHAFTHLSLVPRWTLGGGAHSARNGAIHMR